MRRGMRISCAVLAATVAIAACTQSSDDATPAHAHAGAVDFPVSCNPAVQDDFNHAVTLLHHMTYMQARSAFRAIAERDPSCAMAQWGIAMTLFQPLWPTRPSTADLQRGSELVQKAEALKPPTAREQAFITAVGAFFRDPDSTDYWQRIQRWESAMASLHAAFPTDREGTAFYALALLASARPGPTLQEHSRQAVALLLPILRDDPNHPGAMHYLIHADDVPGREEDDIEIVRRYEKIAPDNPHALHMPTHIYTRLGDWDGVIRGNLRAADAALKFPAGENGELVWDEFPHAIEYLVYAYLQQGADDEAAKQIERLFATGEDRADRQDRIPSRIDARALRARAPGFRRGGRARAARARRPRLGPLSLAGSDRVVRARLRRRAHGRHGRSAARGRAPDRARPARDRSRRGRVRAPDPHASTRARRLERARGA